MTLRTVADRVLDWAMLLTVALGVVALVAYCAGGA